MKGLVPLASGSQGNSLYLGTAESRILIDAGISARALKERLSQIGVDIRSIDAILVTHEHTDHIRGINQLAKHHQIPIFANRGTAEALLGLCDASLPLTLFSTGEDFSFRDLMIFPFPIQHDTAEPVAFTITSEEGKFGICTDLGFATPLVEKALMGSHYLLIESNHEPEMVAACRRPERYKQRVLGRQGHLSNRACAELIGRLYHEDLKHVYLAHLSSECNHPDVALMRVRAILGDRLLSVSIALQHQISPFPMGSENLMLR